MYRRRLNSPTFLKSRPRELNQNHNIYTEGLKGIPGFLSPAATDLLLTSYRQHLRAVSELAFGTTATATVIQAQRELFRIVEAMEQSQGEGRLKNPRLWHHASQAWNLEFFLRGLTCKETFPSESIIQILSKDFGSFDNFKRTFQTHASAIIGCGWIWLTKSGSIKNDNNNNNNRDLNDNSADGNLKILTTFNGATPLFKAIQPTTSQAQARSISAVKNSPILGLNLWESAFVLDYGLDREAYINNWWRAVNWEVVSVLLSK